PGSYYSQQNVIALNVNTKYKSKRFKTGLARGIHFMAVNDPPYLVHCSLGKDRAGFVIALIECFAGASLQEVERDNMLSFYNYFGILPGSREYDFVLNCEIYRFLCEAFGVQKLEVINLSDAAERFFLKIGVSVKDIETLRKKLSS
ncbi:MAG: tyrosine-protein phosphatase, partial [Synergistaceae bacterium]|nr:tyrosine-protein phosphatase [Synergistaceae bacterium]